MDIRNEYRLFIDGDPVESVTGGRLPIVNPSTETELTTVAAGDSRDVERAVAAARETLADWRSRPPAERGELLADVADRIRAAQTELADLETLDTGKPWSQALVDVDGCARAFEYYAGIADKIHGDSIPLGEEYVDYTVREPLGVTAQIIPWNYPIGIFGRSVAPALAAGNTAVVKPAEEAPLSSVRVAEIAADAGLPNGVLNVVPGRGDEAGAALSSHPDVDGVSFTGSVETGRQVGKAAMEHLAHVHLELGGKSPLVVFGDADLDAAIESAVAGLFTSNAGQICSGASRLLVHEDVHDAVVEQLAARVESLTVGPGMDDPDVGPLISADQLDRVASYVDAGRREYGGPLIGGVPDRTGYFVEPTIFDDVDHDSRLAQEEIFGPVLVVTTFADETEAVELANDVDYGLVAGVFTEDLRRAHRFARDVHAGQIYVNEWFVGGIETPFGGYDNSGVGREKGLSAIENYTQEKNVGININP
ncbi:aldehyde dehydrogenase family protein [Halosolutus halophilus]|uniref:aldehyde dehydrogenase family protein n=1 Tax=Halosolutus halophilus TaxID=1552990 RepID=UPI0022351ADC|nr:aldehyde dehydrogenase family protein [Halosolutus halophilus]